MQNRADGFRVPLSRATAGALAKSAWLAVPFLLLCAAGPVAAAGEGAAGTQPEKIAISVLPGTGAPGGRDACLAEAMKAELSARRAKPAGNAFRASLHRQGRCRLEMLATRRPDWYTHMVVRWTIVAPDGKALPKAVIKSRRCTLRRFRTNWCRQAAISSRATRAAYPVIDAVRGRAGLDPSEPAQRGAAGFVRTGVEGQGRASKMRTRHCLVLRRGAGGTRVRVAGILSCMPI